LNDKDIKLTKRELDVLKCLLTGCTVKEAARDIELSPKTVEHYLDNIKAKIGANKKSELIKIILEQKLFI
jgi:DNA-binding NarL/FixJ family response regulator